MSINLSRKRVLRITHEKKGVTDALMPETLGKVRFPQIWLSESGGKILQALIFP